MNKLPGACTDEYLILLPQIFPTMRGKAKDAIKETNDYATEEKAN